jgi:D-alanyl-D-alanine carboxypeptidase/D-alanyl-D-alanine-endopeptidase (penicillin-binding protein 4)
MKIRRKISILGILMVALGIASAQSAGVERSATTSEAIAAELALVTSAVRDPAPARPAAPAAPSAEVLALRADLDRLIQNLSTRNSSHGVLVVSLDRGDTLYAYNPDLPLAPASNMKLFSTAAALYYLGPDFRFSTYALADGPIENGVLQGDLILYGTGDPAISSRMLGGSITPLRALADSLRARGVTEIVGDIVGDGSYFDDHWIAEGWREEYRLDSYSAPVGALSLAENIVSVRVTPGGSAGQPATIRTTPSTEGLLIQNRVTTIASGSSSVRFSYDPEGLVIEGRIARGHPGVARSVTVVDPANFAAAAFRTVLESAGIRVGGGVRTVRRSEGSPISFGAVSNGGGPAVPPRVLGTHLSPTLREVTTVTNHVSQNLFAESLFKTVGRVALGDGSFQGGAQAVQFFLQCEQPFDFSTIRIVDGSGLSPINRITPRVTVHLLDLMTRTDVWDVFYASLPEAASPNGGQHSLRGRMGGTPAARNLRAKTGTIANVSGLSGYVHSVDGELLAFSILTNDIASTNAAKRTEDAIGARLARFTRPADEPAEPLPIGEPVDAAPSSTDDAPDVSGDDHDGPSDDPTPDESEPASAVAARTHRVTTGDTLDGIARRYGTTVAELRELNPGLDPRRLSIGRAVNLPPG